MDLAQARDVRPNQHAGVLRLDRTPTGLSVSGYQTFEMRGAYPIAGFADAKLGLKRALLAKYFTRRILAGRSVLDVGGNAGFFSFWALAEGAASATNIDVDPDYVRAFGEIAAAQAVAGAKGIETTLPDWHEPADVTLAFAMVHWLYNCTTGWGSLDEVMAQLAARTRVLLLIEWVAPTDPAIAFFKHTDRSPETLRGPYTYAAFDEALRGHFRVVEQVGVVSPTRRLVAAWKSDRALRVDASCPMPQLFPAETEVSSTRVAVDRDGVEYWSRVYDLGDRVVKQARRERIAHEVAVMRRLAGTGWVAQVIETQSSATGPWDHFVMERIAGRALADCREELRADALGFARQAVAILAAMRAAGVVHRDITPSNLMVRDGRLVVLDFGWAVVHEEHLGPGNSGISCGAWAPAGLGGVYRTKGSVAEFSDVYSMGMVLEEMIGGVRADLDGVLALMTPQDEQLRPAEPQLLAGLLASMPGGDACAVDEDLNDKGIVA